MEKTVQERRIILSSINGAAFDVGVILNVSKYVPEGQELRFDKRLTGGSDEIWVGPLTAWSFGHNGRYPLESRYQRGMIELERDRRRHPRKDEA